MRRVGVAGISNEVVISIKFDAKLTNANFFEAKQKKVEYYCTTFSLIETRP